MAALRSKGFTFGAIGKRVGCSERTARRYAGNVKPQLVLPLPGGAPESDPRVVRERLISNWLDQLYASTQLRDVTVRVERAGQDGERWVYGCPPSILFMSEAERLLRERLAITGNVALHIMSRHRESQHRFIQEVVAELVSDYIACHLFQQGFGNPGNDWRPPSERPPQPEVEILDPYGLDDS